MLTEFFGGVSCLIIEASSSILEERHLGIPLSHFLVPEGKENINVCENFVWRVGYIPASESASSPLVASRGGLWLGFVCALLNSH